MLSGLRKHTRGLFAAVLLGTLAIAMTVFLIPQDILNLSSGKAVASGDGVEVSAAAYKKAYDDALENYTRQSSGAPFQRRKRVPKAWMSPYFKALSRRAALERLAGKMGFHASDAMVAKQIRDIPAFRSQLTKKFDRATYERLLNQNGLTPETFEANLRSDLRRTQLALPLSAGGYAPKGFAKLIYTYETEQRTVIAAGVPPTIVGKPPTPTDADLQAFYKENQARFGTPEYRTISLAIARPDLFMTKIEVP